MTADTELTIPNTKHPFFITVDASLVGSGANLFQMNEKNKMKVISYNSRILNTQEQNLSTLDLEISISCNSLCITNIRISHYWISSFNIYFHRSQTFITLFCQKRKP